MQEGNLGDNIGNKKKLTFSAGLRFTLSEFSVFTYTKLENSDLEISDFSKTAQNSLKRYELEEETYV